MLLFNPTSKQEELKLLMTRLYNGELQGIPTSVSASTEPEMELMIRNIYKETICPLICAQINAKQQNFLSQIKQHFGFDLKTGITWNFGNTASASGPQATQLKFINGISTPVFTGNNIKGKDNKPFILALVDVISEEIVNNDMDVEIVILEEDSNDNLAENWTSDEFNNKIVREWNGRRVLQGNTLVKLKDGIIHVDEISFTHNAKWKGIRNCRVGARPANAVLYTRVKEAITESVLIKDKRNQLYYKHSNPSLSDNVYHLNKISSRGKCFKRLSKENIKTVMDLLTLNAINPKRLKEILDVRPNTWKAIMDHAQMCKDDKGGIYLYHYPRDGQKSNGVVFNMSGQLMGLLEESQFAPCDKLPYDKQAYARELIVSSSEHWNEVVSFNNLNSLINRFQPSNTLNFLRNSLQVLIPQSISIISPQVIQPTFPVGWCTNNQNNWAYGNMGVACETQSPKRRASQHAISISPKKPKDGHFPSSRLSNTNQAEIFEDEDDEYLQYLNDVEFSRWKKVRYVVGWISMISKVRKRRMNFCHDDAVIFVAASMT